MTFRPDYQPKNNIGKLALLDEMMGYIDKVRHVDVDSLVNVNAAPDVEYEFSVPDAYKEIIQPMISADGVGQGIKKDLLTDIEEDFINKLNLYTYMVEKKVEEYQFPFHEWLNYIEKIDNKYNKISEKLSISYKDILNCIEEVNQADPDLGVSNFGSYLENIKGRVDSPNDFFPYLENYVKRVFPGTNFNDLLCARDTRQVLKVLDKKPVSLSEDSSLFFSYAVSVPNSNWVFKQQEQPPVAFGSKKAKNQVQITFSTSNYDEIFEEFAKTEIWKRISEKDEFKNKFVDELFSAKLRNHPFFTGKTPSMRAEVEVKWDSVEAFVKHVSKDDVALAEKIVSKILVRIPKEKAIQEDHNAQAIKVVNIALHSKLQKEVPIDNPNEKKRNKI